MLTTAARPGPHFRLHAWSVSDFTHAACLCLPQSGISCRGSGGLRQISGYSFFRRSFGTRGTGGAPSPEQKRAALYKPSFHRFGTASRVQVFVQRSLRALPFAVTAELYYAMAMNHIIAQGMSLARFI